MPTQIIIDEGQNTVPNEEVFSEEMISRVKIPSVTPLKAKKTPTSTLTKASTPKVIVTQDDDDDDPNYYADIFNDLCTQREPSPNANKANLPRQNAKCQYDELMPCPVQDYEMGDRFRHIESALSPVKKTMSIEKVKSKQKAGASKKNVLKTPKTLQIMNTDLLARQETKTSVTLKHKSTESLSDTETDVVPDQDAEIVFGKKRKPKVNAKQDISKKFEELPSRIITRARKLTLIVRTEIELKNENLSRLKSKTDKRKEKKKGDDSKRSSHGSKKTPHSNNENKKKVEESAQETQSRSSRSKTKKSEETKSKADNQNVSAYKKGRSTRSTRNKKDNDGKEDKSKKNKEQKESKAKKVKSNSKSRSDSKSTSSFKSRNYPQTRSKTRITNKGNKSKDTSKSKDTKRDKTKTTVTDVRRSSRQKCKESKEVTPKHVNSTIFLSSKSSSESPKNLKRPATNELEVPSPKRTRSLRSSKSSSVSIPASTPVCSTPVKADTQYFLFTAFYNNYVRSKLERLGAVMVTDVMSCTVLVTLEIKRTVKLLCAVGLGRPIVGHDWVKACSDTKTIVDPWLYVLKDVAAEKRFRFSLERTLRGKRNFLKGYNVSATPSVLPTAKEMRLIVECSGGAWKGEGPNWVCVTSSSDKSLWGALRRRGAALVSTEFILGGVLRQLADVAGTAVGNGVEPESRRMLYQGEMLLTMERPGISEEHLQATMNHLQFNMPAKAAYRSLRQHVQLPHDNQRQWQQSITVEERKHLIDLITSSITEHGPSNSKWSRKNPYEVELGFYLMSSSRDEYYRQLAEKTRQMEDD